jgi:hypothetical protein
MRGALWITAVGVMLMAGCGRGSSAAESPPPAPPEVSDPDMSDPEEPAVTLAALDSSIPIFETISTPPTAAPVGRRLWADGRHEHLGGRDRSGEWVLLETLSDGEVTAFRLAIADLGLDRLQARYEPEHAVRDAGRTEWRIQVGGQRVQVEIIAGVQVPELVALDKALIDAHVQPEVTIEVTALARGSEHQATVPCPPTAIDDLGAAFMAMVRAQTGTGPLDGQGEPLKLLDVVWHTDGALSGHHELWTDGRMVRTLPQDDDVRETWLSAAELDGVRVALDAVDWPTLASRCL